MEPDAPDFERRPEDEEPHRDTGMIGSDAEEPGPGRDASPTDPDPLAASPTSQGGRWACPSKTRSVLALAHKETASGIDDDLATDEEVAADRAKRPRPPPTSPRQPEIRTSGPRTRRRAASTAAAPRHPPQPDHHPSHNEKEPACSSTRT